MLREDVEDVQAGRAVVELLSLCRSSHTRRHRRRHRLEHDCNQLGYCGLGILLDGRRTTVIILCLSLQRQAAYTLCIHSSALVFSTGSPHHRIILPLLVNYWVDHFLVSGCFQFYCEANGGPSGPIFGLQHSSYSSLFSGFNRYSVLASDESTSFFFWRHFSGLQGKEGEAGKRTEAQMNAS